MNKNPSWLECLFSQKARETSALFETRKVQIRQELREQAERDEREATRRQGHNPPPSGSTMSCGHKWAYARSEKTEYGFQDVLFCEQCGQVKKV